MTTLEAVNVILRSGGLRTVAALDTDGSSDASEAERFLHESSLEVQSQGWHVNTKTGITYSPDADGNITFGDNIISIDTSGKSASVDAVMIGRKLYDNYNDTYTWTADIVCDYIEYLGFTCLPQPLAEYIARKAAYEFVSEKYNIGAASAHLVQKADDRFKMARSRAHSFDSRTTNLNMLDTSPFRRARGDGLGYYRG